MAIQVTVEFNNEDDAQEFRVHVEREGGVWVDSYSYDVYKELPARLVDQP